MRSLAKSWSVLAIPGLTLLFLLGGPPAAKADVAYGQSCSNGQCGFSTPQAMPLAILTPLAPTPIAQSAPCVGGSCGVQSASFKQTVTYSTGRPGLFRRIFSRGSARSCK